jgi:hypothetical protein
MSNTKLEINLKSRSLCISDVQNLILKALVVVDVSLTTSFGPPLLANPLILRTRQFVEFSRTPGLELISYIVGIAVGSYDNVNVIRAAISNVEMPLSNSTVVRYGLLKKRSLFWSQITGWLFQELL